MSTERLSTNVRRKQIARAALELIAAQGFSALTMEVLARRVGLVPSAIYRHFENKDRLLDALLDTIREGLLGNVAKARVDTEDALERLRTLLGFHVLFIRENRGLPRIVFSEQVYMGSAGRRAQVYGIIQAYLREVERIIEDGQRRGRVCGDLPAATLAVVFLGLVQPAAVLWHMSDGEFDLDRHAERSWRAFERMAVAR
jgi:AcrR family transcriptional regulator